jgi:hypothetical protein
MWLVWNIPLGPLVPWVLALAVGRWPNKQERMIRVTREGR